MGGWAAHNSVAMGASHSETKRAVLQPWKDSSTARQESGLGQAGRREPAQRVGALMCPNGTMWPVGRQSGGFRWTCFSVTWLDELPRLAAWEIDPWQVCLV
jgi:hypothetical protein